LPPTPLQLTEIVDYREELTVSLASAREIAAASIKKAQQRYKANYDKKATRSLEFRVGDWVMVRFPPEESGKKRKLSRPWHGPYRVTSVANPDVWVTKMYFPGDGVIQVHQSRVKACPPEIPGGFYWYGVRRPGPGRPPKWVNDLLDRLSEELEGEETSAAPPNGSNSADRAELRADGTLGLSEFWDASETPLQPEQTKESGTSDQPLPSQLRYSLRQRNHSGRTKSNRGVM
jgi:hypothetical protein